MKTIFLLFLSLILFSCANKNEKTTSINNSESKIKPQMKNDSLVLKKYVGGDPFINKINTEIEVAKSWGFIIQYTFGDCQGTDDHLNKKFKKENKKTKTALKNVFGENWEIIFQNQVIFNLNNWYLNIKNLDNIIKYDSLKLTTKKSSTSIKFNTNNKYTLIFETNNSKEVIESYYHLTEKQLHLMFPNGKKIIFNYKIKQKEINLTQSN